MKLLIILGLLLVGKGILGYFIFRHVKQTRKTVVDKLNKLSIKKFRVIFHANFSSGKKEDVDFGIISASSTQELNDKIQQAQANYTWKHFSAGEMDPIWGDVDVNRVR